MVDERRHSPVRRQFNDAFIDEGGRISLSKLVAFAGQVAALYHFGKSFDLLVEHWDSLLVVLAFIVSPELIKKLITMKYGGGIPSTSATTDFQQQQHPPVNNI